MKRKLTTFAAATLTLSLVLTGCGNNNNNNNKNNSGKTTKQNQVKESNFNETGLPIVKNTVTIKAMAPKAALAPNFGEMEMVKRIEKDTNVHIEWSNIVEKDYMEKKNLTLASGNLPDVFYGSRFSDVELMKYGKDGTIVPLEDLIDKYMPNVKALFDKKPDLKAFCTAPDGHIYSLPGGEEFGDGQGRIGSNPDFIFINKVWLDKLKLAVPTTLDEYYNVLKAFKTQDPNGNGKPDEIPLTFLNGWWTGDIGYLFGAFGTPDKMYQPDDRTYIEHLNVKDGKVTFAATEPGYKEAISTFSKWIKEGLIDKEAFTYEMAAYFAAGKTKDERLGSFIWWEENEIVGADRAKDYIVLPPFKGMVVKNNNGSPWGRNSAVITKANKNPEVTARWLDHLYEPFISAQIAWGPIGEIFDEVDGKLVYKTLPEGVNAGEIRQKVSPGGVGFVSAEVLGSSVAMEERAKERIKRINDYFVPQMEKDYYPTIFYMENELDRISVIKPEIQKYVNQKRATWLMKGEVGS